jgi:hypothetical protein
MNATTAAKRIEDIRITSLHSLLTGNNGKDHICGYANRWEWDAKSAVQHGISSQGKKSQFLPMETVADSEGNTASEKTLPQVTFMRHRNITRQAISYCFI